MRVHYNLQDYPHDDQRLAASDPDPQFALGQGRWGPGGWVLAGTEIDDCII